MTGKRPNEEVDELEPTLGTKTESEGSPLTPSPAIKTPPRPRASLSQKRQRSSTAFVSTADASGSGSARDEKAVQLPVNAAWMREVKDGDAVLRSEDGVDFVVQKYYLQAGSDRLRRILGGEPSELIDDIIFKITVIQAAPHHIISLPTPAGDLAAFLSLAQNHEPTSTPTVPQLTRLAELVRHLSASSLTARLQVTLYRQARSKPWDVFVLAAKMGDTDIAKAALKCMGKDRNKGQLDLTHLTPAVVKGMGMEWVLALVRAMARHPGFDHSMEGGRAVSKWGLISEEFEM